MFKIYFYFTKISRRSNKKLSGDIFHSRSWRHWGWPLWGHWGWHTGRWTWSWIQDWRRENRDHPCCHLPSHSYPLLHCVSPDAWCYTEYGVRNNTSDLFSLPFSYSLKKRRYNFNERHLLSDAIKLHFKGFILFHWLKSFLVTVWFSMSCIYTKWNTLDFRTFTFSQEKFSKHI